MMEQGQITLNLSKELKDKLQREAQERGYTIKDLIAFILHRYFENIVRE